MALAETGASKTPSSGGAGFRQRRNHNGNGKAE